MLKELENKIENLKKYERTAINNQQFIKAMRYHQSRRILEKSMRKENGNDEINT